MFSTAFISCGPSKSEQLAEKTALLERLNQTYVPPANTANLSETITKFAQSDDTKVDACSHYNRQLLLLALKDKGLKLLGEDFNRQFDVGTDCMQNTLGVMSGSDGNLKDEFLVLAISYNEIASKKASVNISALLEIIRILKVVDFNRRSVMLAFLDGKGSGREGAKFLAKAIKRNGFDVAATLFLNLDDSALRPDQIVVTGMYQSDIPTIMDKAVSGYSIEDATYVDNRALFHSYESREFQNVLESPSHTIATNVYGGEMNTQDAVAEEMAIFLNRIMPGIVALCKGAEISIPE